MELTETHTLPVPQARAWEALNDTSMLKVCIPGCDSIDADGENAYNVAMTASVGPVKARFKGRMELTNIDAPHTYTIVFEGQGGAAGFSKGSATVNLEPGDEADTTKLSYSAHAQVGGKLAQIGSRLVDGAARKIAGEFFKRFSAQLQGGQESQGAGAADENGGEVQEGQEKGKKSWTAWISKS
ncbi:carbon monoxide dehydrogenase subunit G [Caballeronia turbans]|jgi:carbon monoxide dehydrogenase subunit G|uniref:CoxG family protein n=1 Tax=unclassified Caballeronia TaxID=2646786 RepID=UPI00074B7067|nr:MULTISPECIES: carbon monoxide dehydrogenase subunit G [unclassified Caballeronia]SAL18850.1 carbon monoxide dehydrogenase subunit G [Caballeronia turbans]